MRPKMEKESVGYCFKVLPVEDKSNDLWNLIHFTTWIRRIEWAIDHRALCMTVNPLPRGICQMPNNRITQTAIQWTHP